MHMAAVRLALIFLLQNGLPVAAAPKEVCITGFIMDTFCIERGTLLDNPSVQTLENPEQHSIHCLADVPRCYNSGFEVLALTAAAEAAKTGKYCRAFKLDAAGNTAAHDLARATGSADLGCSTCDGGSMKMGFRATVKGTYDPDDSGDVKVLTAASVESADIVCPAGTSPPADVCSSTSGAGASAGFVVAHGTLMMASWGVLLPSGVLIAHFLRHRDPLWFKLHRAIQVCGLCLALAGFIIAVTQFDVFAQGYYAPAQAHGSCGLVVMVLGLLQPINAYFRPHKDKAALKPTPARQRWEWLHKGSGWFAILLSVPTIIVGTTLAGGSNTLPFQIAYGIVVALLLTMICLLLRDRGLQARADESDSGLRSNPAVK